MARWPVPLLALILAACGHTPAAPVAGIECVPYARAVSGIALYGDAASWWDAAAGRYARTTQPSSGAVLVFRRTARLPHGHVAVVAGLYGDRAIHVNQANWVPRRIAGNEPVVDVSPANDWSAVRVWWQPAGQLGATVYPTFGFIEPKPAADLVASR